MEADPFDRASWRAATAAEEAATQAEGRREQYLRALAETRAQADLLLSFVEALMDGSPEGSTVLRLTREEALALAAAVWRAQ
jgi:hypothetical protein